MEFQIFQVDMGVESPYGLFGISENIIQNNPYETTASYKTLVLETACLSSDVILAKYGVCIE